MYQSVYICITHSYGRTYCTVQHQCTYVVYCRNLALLLRSISFRLRLTCFFLTYLRLKLQPNILPIKIWETIYQTTLKLYSLSNTGTGTFKNISQRWQKLFYIKTGNLYTDYCSVDIVRYLYTNNFGSGAGAEITNYGYGNFQFLLCSFISSRWSMIKIYKL